MCAASVQSIVPATHALELRPAPVFYENVIFDYCQRRARRKSPRGPTTSRSSSEADAAQRVWRPIFAMQRHCPKCSTGEMSDVPLPRQGTLVACRIQGFPPGAPFKGHPAIPWHDHRYEVAIIGIGLHPFDRFDKTAMKMGAEAIQSAPTDARDHWQDIQFGLRGQLEVSNPDA